MAWWAADVVGMICASGWDKSQLRENGRWENVYNKHNVLRGEGEGLNSSQMAKDCHLLSIYYVANPHGCKHIIATNSSEVNNNLIKWILLLHSFYRWINWGITRK